jgi:hypothetical protein
MNQDNAETKRRGQRTVDIGSGMCHAVQSPHVPVYQQLELLLQLHKKVEVG